jgi:hypothetical protein
VQEEFDAENAALMKKAREFLEYMEPDQGGGCCLTDKFNIFLF